MNLADYDVKRCTRQCSASGREFEPGEIVYSALVADGADVVRRDYAKSHWKGAPENTIAWWRYETSSASNQGADAAPHEVLINYFERLCERGDKPDETYVMALLLARRRIGKIVSTETSEEGAEILVLRIASTENEYHVEVTQPDAKQVESIQDQLTKLLFSNNVESSKASDIDENTDENRDENTDGNTDGNTDENRDENS